MTQPVTIPIIGVPGPQGPPATGVVNTQAQWHVDAQNGSDTNDGRTQGTALRTWAQYLFRTGYEERFDGRITDVYLYGTFPSSDPIVKRALTADSASHYWIHGGQGLTQQLSTTLTSFTASVPASNTPAQFTVAGGLVSGMVGGLAYFPAVDSWAVIVSVSGQTATILDPTTNPQNAPTCARNTPASNAAVIVYTQAATVSTMAIEHWSAVAVTPAQIVFPPPFGVDGVSVTGMTTVGGESTPNTPVVYQKCHFGDVISQGGKTPYFRQSAFAGNGLSRFVGSYEAGPLFQGCAHIQLGGSVDVSGACFGFSTSQDVNHIGGAARWFFIDHVLWVGRVGLATSVAGAGGGVSLTEAVLECDNGEAFGVCAGSYALNLKAKGNVFYHSFTLYATGATSQISWKNGSTAMPSIVGSAGGSLPATATCTTWTQLLASPFNGSAYDYGSQGMIVPI